MYMFNLYRTSFKFFATIIRNATSIESSYFHLEASSHELSRLQTRTSPGTGSTVYYLDYDLGYTLFTIESSSQDAPRHIGRRHPPQKRGAYLWSSSSYPDTVGGNNTDYAKLYEPTERGNPPNGYPKRAGRKKALCIGINYLPREGYHQVHEKLQGCINDVEDISRFLSEFWRFNFEGSIEIKVLRDDRNSPDEKPTRNNIIEAMRWLVDDARPDESLFIHFSGHGGQIPDKDGDETDKQDEGIYTFDGDYIVDDELNTLLKSLPAGCKLTALFDTCHSGSVLDLPHVWNSTKGLFQLEVSVTKDWTEHKSTEAEIICISSCEDKSKSADSPHGGPLTDAFIMFLKHDAYPTYKQFFDSISEIMKGKYKQTPQISCSRDIDTERFFVL